MTSPLDAGGGRKDARRGPEGGRKHRGDGIKAREGEQPGGLAAGSSRSRALTQTRARDQRVQAACISDTSLMLLQR